jgi:AraC family transcriptional regulator
MNVRRESLGPMRFIGLPHRGPYHLVGAAWERFQPLAAAHGLIRPGAMMVSLYLDDPSEVPPEALRSLAAIRVPEGTAAPPGMEAFDLAGGDFLIATHMGSYDGLGAAWRQLAGPLLAESPWQWRPGASPCFDHYVNDCRAVAVDDLRTDLCIPVVARV